MLRSAFTGGGDVGKQNEDIARWMMAKVGYNPTEIERAITTGTGLVAYDLQAPAKQLYPSYTPFRNRITRTPGGIGTATNWKQIRKLTGSGFNAMGWVPEGQRAGQMSFTVDNKAASYKSIGEEIGATFEAINAAQGFEDLQARNAVRLLQKVFYKEEMAILGGNEDLALGTPTTPTTSASGAGATLPAATYTPIVVALSFEGYQNYLASGAITESQTVNGADGRTFSINGGSSNKSAAGSQAVTLGQTLFMQTTPIQGAFAYAWFVGTAGAEKLERVTTVAHTAFSAPLVGTGQAASTITGDKSTNTLAFNGLMTHALKAGSGAIIKTLANGTPGTGTKLTASGQAGVIEIDDILQQLWDDNQVSARAIWCNSQEQRAITAAVLSGGSNPALNINRGDKAHKIVANGVAVAYYNPFKIAEAGDQVIPINIHPNLPPGTIYIEPDELPIQYQSPDVPHVAEMLMRQDYYQIDWPVTTRERMRGIYAEGTLAVYAPFTMAMITNIAK